MSHHIITVMKLKLVEYDDSYHSKQNGVSFYGQEITVATADESLYVFSKNGVYFYNSCLFNSCIALRSRI